MQRVQQEQADCRVHRGIIIYYSSVLRTFLDPLTLVPILVFAVQKTQGETSPVPADRPLESDSYLQIKCDRQSPCSGCAKRSNDPRVCVYLTANTERPYAPLIYTFDILDTDYYIIL
jgi:hypothetical protein